MQFNTLHVATTVELAENLDGWVTDNDVRILIADSPHLTGEELAIQTGMAARDPKSEKLNAALCSFRPPLLDEPWLELTVSPIRHLLVRTVADRFEQIRLSQPEIPMLGEGKVNFANSIVVHLLVITLDGFMLIGHRSGRPRFYENCWAVTCEEHIDFNLDAGCPFRAARRGVKEELVGRDLDFHEGAIRFFSLFREIDHWQGANGVFWDVNIGLAGQLRLALTVNDVFEKWRSTAPDKREFRHLIAVPYDADWLWRVLFTDNMEPPAWGSDVRVPDGTDPAFPDIRGNTDWQRQHPTNKIHSHPIGIEKKLERFV